MLILPKGILLLGFPLFENSIKSKKGKKRFAAIFKTYRRKKNLSRWRTK